MESGNWQWEAGPFDGESRRHEQIFDHEKYPHKWQNNFKVFISKSYASIKYNRNNVISNIVFVKSVNPISILAAFAIPQSMLEQRTKKNYLWSMEDAAEDASHIFFNCSLAKFAWSVFKELLGCNWTPSCSMQFYAFLSRLSGQTWCLSWIIFLAILGSLANTKQTCDWSEGH